MLFGLSYGAIEPQAHPAAAEQLGSRLSGSSAVSRTPSRPGMADRSLRDLYVENCVLFCVDVYFVSAGYKGKSCLFVEASVHLFLFYAVETRGVVRPSKSCTPQSRFMDPHT